jgi:hypothetical protein
METLMQFMVIKKNGTKTLITGIGDSKDFSFADKFASWLGIVLMHTNLQIISTTRESQKRVKILILILMQIAQAAARKKKIKLKDFLNGRKNQLDIQRQSLL